MIKLKKSVQVNPLLKVQRFHRKKNDKRGCLAALFLQTEAADTARNSDKNPGRSCIHPLPSDRNLSAEMSSSEQARHACVLGSSVRGAARRAAPRSSCRSTFDSGLFHAREANDESRGLPVFINLNQYSNLGEVSGCVRAGVLWCVCVCVCVCQRECV